MVCGSLSKAALHDLALLALMGPCLGGGRGALGSQVLGLELNLLWHSWLPAAPAGSFLWPWAFCTVAAGCLPLLFSR